MINITAFCETTRRSEALLTLGGRPHWGQYNSLMGVHELIRRMYPAYDRLEAVHRSLNRKGTFDNLFRRRVGFTTHPDNEP